MGKEFKSCTGVLLRADLIGHGHPTRFGRKGLNGHALLGQPSKGHPCRISTFFSTMFYYIISTTHKKLETYFSLLYFWTFELYVIILHLSFFLESARVESKNMETFDECNLRSQWRLDKIQKRWNRSQLYHLDMNGFFNSLVHMWADFFSANVFVAYGSTFN